MEFINPTKEKWNEFLTGQSGSFLQSWEWLDFQETTGKKVFRYLIEDSGEIIFLAGIIKHNLPLNKNYFYLPYGPTADLGISQNLVLKNFNFFLNEIQKIAKSEKSIFIKLESFKNPTLYSVSDISHTLYSVGESKSIKKPNDSIKNDFIFKKSDSLQPKQTLIIDLTKSDQDLLSEMHHKTRYNIRLAERKDVKIKFKERPTDTDFENFWNLMEKTSKRDKFHLHPKNYYKKMIYESKLKTELAFAYLKSSDDPKIKNNIRSSDDLILAANLIIYFGDTATYLHGASSNEHRELMAPYLLQWQSFLRAKSLGCKKYDFWGISENKWPGVTRFKKGFGGYEVQYVDTYNIIFSKFWHLIYKIAKFFKKII